MLLSKTYFSGVRGDEARLVQVFEKHLLEQGWTVTREVEFCDLVAERPGQKLMVEAKGRTAAPGLDVDTMYGQILRRMPIGADDDSIRFAVVVPAGAAERAALRVSPRVRELLRITVYSVTDTDRVVGPL